MQNPVPDNAYLLGTQFGAAIPLDMARPKAALILGLNTGATISITLPEDINLTTVYCDKAFLLVASEAALPADGVWIPEGFYGEAGTFYDLLLPKVIQVRAAEAGTIKINTLVRWAAVANEGAYRSS